MALSLDEQLAKLPPDVQATLQHHRFDPARFKRLAQRLVSESAEDNFVKGKIRAPKPEDLARLPNWDDPEYARLRELGAEALAHGQVALLVLAGGMATRMGGVIKALVEAVPGRTFLDLRRAEVRALERRYQAVPPLWLMTSHSTDAGIRAALGDDLDGHTIATFTQHLSLRVTPSGDIFFDEKGRPSEHAPGHGDLPDALKESGLLDAFVKRGGKVIMVSNIDNLGGTLDPVVIGFHLAHGKPVTSEVVDKLPSDRGGIPAYVDDTLCVLEEFRIPPSFDPASVRVFNTNVFHFDAKAILDLDIPWTYFTVRKKVGDQPVVQFERLVNEVTSYLPTAYLHMPRDGATSRFLPVKDNEELAARVPEILAAARARGIIS
ncbi:MAG TPA: UTP--glucose-1-phosphate uridylyltransferase [Polyangiaceae bacterium]|jgi:UTP--glucose-1-phosphate uridylyltransferase|nr:UTP--glucose-1-phosphate uridylyltransferase [Polyangiaceae bacterium]